MPQRPVGERIHRDRREQARRQLLEARGEAALVGPVRCERQRDLIQAHCRKRFDHF